MPLPAATAAWRRAAEQAFAAGGHGPVEFPTADDSPIPAPPDNHIFMASNHRPSTRLPLAHRAFLARKTAEELVTRGIERVHDWRDVAAVLPMFVVEQDDGKKLRVIFDGRALNRLLSPSRGSVSYESVRDALTAGAYCTKLDIEAAFRNVLVGESSRRYLCFEVEGRLYRYRSLPFGVSWSPALFVRALQPVIDKLRESNIRLIWYVDDLLVVADSVQGLDHALTTVIETFLDTGWLPSATKTFPYAFTSIRFLGLSVTFRNGRGHLSVPPSRAERIRTEADTLARQRVVHVAQLQRLAGRLAFVGMVVPQVGFLRRGIDAAISDGLKARHGCIPVIDMVKEELLAVGAAARDFTKFSLSREDEVRRRRLGTVYSDASATGWGVLHLLPGAPMVKIPDLPDFEPPGGQQPEGWTAGRRFSPEEIQLPSAAREILAVVGGVVALDLHGGDVNWHSDATAAVAAISRWRTRSTAVATVLKDLWNSLLLRDLRIHISHVYRDAELMPVADFLSRRAWRERQAEWQFPPGLVPHVLHSLRIPVTVPMADLFASQRNALFRPYCSRWAEPGSIGDAFHVEWRRPTWWWAFPPLSQVERVLLRLDCAANVAEEAATSPSTAAASAAPPPINVVLIYPVVPSLARVRKIIARLARRDVLLSVPSPAPATTTPRPLLPGLRLLDAEGKPAPSAPPWPLRAALLHVP